MGNGSVFFAEPRRCDSPWHGGNGPRARLSPGHHRHRSCRLSCTSHNVTHVLAYFTFLAAKIALHLREIADQYLVRNISSRDCRARATVNTGARKPPLRGSSCEDAQVLFG